MVHYRKFNSFGKRTYSIHCFWQHLLGHFIADTPDAPHGLITEQGVGSDVTLSWLSPLNDGGSMVTEYLIEKKDLTSDKWIKVATTRY